MSSQQFNIRLESEVSSKLDVIAQSAYTTKNQFASMALGVLSEIEPKLVLTALGELKAKYGRRPGPGRPPSRARKTATNAA